MKETLAAQSTPGPNGNKADEQSGKKPIGGRDMTVFETSNMLICGLSEQEARQMTPEYLADLADAVTDDVHTTFLLGS